MVIIVIMDKIQLLSAVDFKYNGDSGDTGDNGDNDIRCQTEK